MWRSNQRRVQDFFHLGEISFLGGAEIFSSEAEKRPKSEQKFSASSKKIYFWGITYKRDGAWGGEYLIIAKEKLVLASAPYESFFPLGQEHTISNFIRGIFRGGIFPLWFDSSWEYAPYAPRLHTPLGVIKLSGWLPYVYVLLIF